MTGRTKPGRQQREPPAVWLYAERHSWWVGECPSGEALAQSRRTPAPAAPAQTHTNHIIPVPRPGAAPVTLSLPSF
jgi:hypothetical protein